MYGKLVIKPIKNDVVDDFIANNDLFALFEAPINLIFIDNFINNINKFKDIIMHYNMHNNIFFSCKANKSYALLYNASKAGCGIEVSSLYELKDALKYTKKIIASGPAKEEEYLSKALENNATISIDDIEELKYISKMRKNANVLLRISNLLNNISRFGINISQIDDCIRIIKESENKIFLEGFSFHINNYNLNDRIEAIKQIIQIINEKKLKINYIDIGGGFPVNYCEESAYEEFTKANNSSLYFNNKLITDFYPYYNNIANEKSLDYILKNTSKLLNGIELIIEPGRSLLNNCGISIYEVKYLKKLFDGENIIVTNGNINCLSEQWFNTDYLIEPTLYKKVNVNKLKKPIIASVAGNLCLEQDLITKRKIQFNYLPERGDYLIYYNTAGYQMDSNESEFNKIPLLKKIVVTKNGDKYYLKGDNEYGSKENN